MQTRAECGPNTTGAVSVSFVLVGEGDSGECIRGAPAIPLLQTRKICRLDTPIDA